MKRTQLLQSWDWLGPASQGSSCLATLGYVTKPFQGKTACEDPLLFNSLLSGSRHRRLLVKVLLEAGEGFVDLCGSAAEVGYGIGQGVVVFEQE